MPTMATPEEEKDLGVRNLWQHEALEFTPWLAKNLVMLGKALGGMQLKLDQMEAPVGPFFCDILATKVATDVKVAIENQLEWSDHSHLTQLLTYAAGLDARIAVWVAPAFRYEHAAALHWLNEWTRDGLQFYAVRILLQKTGPCLQPVVAPGDWNKDITEPQGATMSPLAQRFHAFFRPLVAELLGAGFAAKATQHYGSSDRFFPSHPGVG